MAVVCDTGAVYALYDADDAQHEAARSVVESETGELFLPVVLLAEIDHLLTNRLGSEAAIDFIESVEAEAFHYSSPNLIWRDAVNSCGNTVTWR